MEAPPTVTDTGGVAAGGLKPVTNLWCSGLMVKSFILLLWPALILLPVRLLFTFSFFGLEYSSITAL